jgi:hypothetical protein
MDEENYSINNNSKIDIENNPLSEIAKSDGKRWKSDKNF